MELNTGQKFAKDLIVDGFLGNLQGFTLIGEGGVGKTFTCAEIVKELREAGLKVAVSAPTNKAVKQLEKSLARAGIKHDDGGPEMVFSTLHKLLGLAMLPTAEKPRATSVRDSILDQFDVLVLDEASMLSKILLEEYLLPEAARGLRILFMGDAMQLPPVKETDSYALKAFDSHELTQMMRQQNNPDGTDNGIPLLCKPLRKAIDEGKRYKFDMTMCPGNNVKVIPDAHFLRTIVDYFTFETNLEDVRVIAWRNRRVDDINRAIRKKLYGPDAERFETGERITTGKPVVVNTGGGPEVLLGTDEECFVLSCRESQMVDPETGDAWKTHLLSLNPIYADKRQVFVHVLHEDEQERFDRRVSHLRALALDAVGSASGFRWRTMHKFVELFSDIRYCYCITAHRSQGSTYRVGFVDVKDMLENPKAKERKQLIYVGYSRFSELLHINKTRFEA